VFLPPPKHLSHKAGQKSPKTIVITHLNADFDAVASAVAAARLYPEPVIVLPGSQEKAVRDYLRSMDKALAPFASMKEIDTSKVKQIVVVDANQKSRLGQAAQFLSLPGVKIHLFDHHQQQECDIEADQNSFADYGSNTTLMVKLLRRKGISLSRQEATILLIGIYEDTGSFTFSSTKPEDLKQASWLLEQGGDIKQIAHVIGSRFTPEHIALLNDLLQSAQTYNFGTLPVTIAKTSSPGYVDDFAVLAHELMDMGRLQVLFTLALMSDQVIIVARSRTSRADVAEILREIGGGGHASAASATLKNVTLSEAENLLMSAIEKHLGSSPKVKDIMSAPVVHVAPDMPIFEVHDLFAKYGFSIIPIVEEGRLVGYVTRNTVEKAIYHGLGIQPVAEFMSTDFQVLSPEDTLSQIQELIVQGHQRFIPVLEDGQIVGIITRTDLLEVISSDPSKRPESLLPPRAQRKNVAFLLRQRLPQKTLKLLKTAGIVADKLGMNVYVVGGFVRDLLLRKENFDIDLVVEGDGIRFAKELGKRFSARVKAHKKFGTSVIIFPDGFKIDVATARWEYYEYPAAMPTVAISSIKLDLFRRDFTINTLAIKLNPKDFGLLIDFFGGQRDIKDGIIRVLHSLSFIDDPTRILRAVRFEKRFGFKIGKHTLRLIKNTLKLGILDKLSSKRLLTELKLILEEQDPRGCIKRLNELKILQVIHPALLLDNTTIHTLNSLYHVLAWYDLLYRDKTPKKWLIYLTGILSGLKPAQRGEAVKRLGIEGAKAKLIVEAPETAQRICKRIEEMPQPKNSDIYRLLKDLDLEILLFSMAICSETVRQVISHYITHLLLVRPELTGQDLKKLGFTPGPVYRKILDRLLEARLDNEVRDRQSEIDLVIKEFGEKKK